MTSPQNAHQFDDVLTLELRVDGALNRFELAPHEEAALVVGAASEADLRLQGRGMAPVHFHFERQGDAVWLIPTASAGSLRLDTRRLTGAAKLPTRSVVEACGFRVEVTLRRGPQEPIDTEDVPAPKTPGAEDLQAAHRAYARGLPDEDDETRVGEAPITAPLAEQATRAVAAVRRDPERFGTSTMKLTEFEELQKLLRGVDVPCPTDPRRLPATTQRLELPADPEPARCLAPDRVPIVASPTIEVKGPTSREFAAASDSLEPANVPAPAIKARVDLPGALETTVFDMPPIAAPEQAPGSPGVTFTRSVAPEAERGRPAQPAAKPPRKRPLLGAALEAILQAAGALGLAVRRHPVRVGTVAITVSVLVAALAAGLARTLSVNSEPTPRPDVARAATAPKRSAGPSDANTGVLRRGNEQLARGVPQNQKSKPNSHPAMEILVPPRSSKGTSGGAGRPVVRPVAKQGTARETPAKSDLALAVGYLVTGRHLQAARAYAALAAQASEDPTYGAIARLLERHAECSAAKPRPQACPEVQ